MNLKDIGAGLVFIAIGVFFSVEAAMNLAIGTSLAMGPGYFPAVVGGVLAVFGVAIALRGLGAAPSPFGAVSWRGVALIGLAPIVFGATVRGLGMAPTIVLTTLISVFASHRVGLVKALALTAGLTVFCVLVFHYGLGLPTPLLGSWLRD
jgi:hypothetical protein